jgi:hypothetical protein
MGTGLHLRWGGISAWARLAAVVAAILAVTALVVSRSESAFSSTTGNSGNTLSTGSVVLSDNDSGGALFNVSGLIPGQVTTRCIEVTYSGSMAPSGAVRLYGAYVDGPDANATADSALADYLDLRIELGNSGVTCSSTFAGSTLFDSTTPTASAGTMTAFTSSYDDWASGLSTTWSPPANSNLTRAFRITATVRDDNGAQARTAEPAFTWEVRSN